MHSYIIRIKASPLNKLSSLSMSDLSSSFISYNVFFIKHARYKAVFALRRELAAVCSRAHIITGVLWFRKDSKELLQNMAWVGRDGPKESLDCNIGHVCEQCEGLSRA